jgi:hypothetical protein
MSDNVREKSWDVDVIGVLVEVCLQTRRSLRFWECTVFRSVREGVNRIIVQVWSICVRIFLLRITPEIICEYTLLLFWRKTMWITILHVAVTIVWLLKKIMTFGNECSDCFKQTPWAIDYHMEYWNSLGMALRNRPAMCLGSVPIVWPCNMELKSNRGLFLKDRQDLCCKRVKSAIVSLCVRTNEDRRASLQRNRGWVWKVSIRLEVARECVRNVNKL